MLRRSCQWSLVRAGSGWPLELSWSPCAGASVRGPWLRQGQGFSVGPNTNTSVPAAPCHTPRVQSVGPRVCAWAQVSGAVGKQHRASHLRRCFRTKPSDCWRTFAVGCTFFLFLSLFLSRSLSLSTSLSLSRPHFISLHIILKSLWNTGCASSCLSPEANKKSDNKEFFEIKKPQKCTQYLTNSRVCRDIASQRIVKIVPLALTLEHSQYS